jgi:hypothetical protein
MSMLIIIVSVQYRQGCSLVKQVKEAEFAYSIMNGTGD